MALTSRGVAHWEGDLMSGNGTTTLATSGAAGPLPVTWKARTEDHGALTSPEELIAAAHAACYSMAFSNILAKAGTPPDTVDTEAVATFGPTDAGFRILSIELTVTASVPGISEEDFAAAAESAKDGCPVSQALKGNVDLSVTATLT
jgi:osmotically inducible protein OsmC